MEVPGCLGSRFGGPRSRVPPKHFGFWVSDPGLPPVDLPGHGSHFYGMPQISSKRKQKLNEEFLKKRNKTREERYKTYEISFETLKKKSKKFYFSNLIGKYKNKIKRTWDVMKQIIAKSRFKIKKHPHRVVIDAKEISDEKTIATKFNHFQKYQ